MNPFIEKLQRGVASSSRNPFVSVIIAALLILAACSTQWMPDATRPIWLSLLAFGFALFTWFSIEAKRWPDMRIEVLRSAEQIFQIHSQDGAFALAAWFRFFNGSSETNAVIGSKYWLCIGNSGEWLPISHADIVPEENWLSDCMEKIPNAALNLPAAYPPHAADVRCVAFSAKVPWKRQGDEKPSIRLRAEFEMIEGGRKVAEVDLKWQGTFNPPLPKFRP